MSEVEDKKKKKNKKLRSKSIFFKRIKCFMFMFNGQINGFARAIKNPISFVI